MTPISSLSQLGDCPNFRVPTRSGGTKMGLSPLDAPLALSNSSPAAAAPAAAGGDSFKSFLLDSIQQVNSMQQAADQAVEKLAAGGDVNPAEVLTAVQKADIAFKLMLQVRNKIVSIYEEVQAMRV
jgi:flagellar hook-basal body complex protein FliE